MSGDHRAGLFPALLKHWRGQRGLSQLDLGLAAGVSSRHVSFLETGRSSPSAEMVLRLGTALDVPLRHINAMLQAAGHQAHFPQSSSPHAWPSEVVQALTLLKEHQEPFPFVVVNRTYDVLDLNRGALALFMAVAPHRIGPGEVPNLAKLTFDPEGAHPAMVNFDEVGRTLLWRLQREVLADPNDAPLRELLSAVLAMPTVAEDWRDADLSASSSPALVIHLRVRERDLRFVTMVTAFQAPQAVVVDELRIETWLPHDAATAAACQELVDAMSG